MPDARAESPDTRVVLSEAWVTAEPHELRILATDGVVFAEGRRRINDEWATRVLLTQSAETKLRRSGHSVLRTRPDHRRGAPRDGYRTPDEGELHMRALALDNPRAGLAQWGESVDEAPIMALWIGQAPDSGGPVWRLLAGHHGDEWSAFEVALDVASTLVDGDGTDSAITSLLDQSTVWVVPYVNPDGVVRGSRFNANLVDINRNYDYEWGSTSWAPGDNPFSEPESRAVRTASLLDLPHASLSLHAGAANIGYVWNHTQTPSDDNSLLLELALAYGSLATVPEFWVTNGAAWYETNGDTNDWSYGRYGGLDFTVEVTDEKTPPASEIPSFTAQHRDAVIGFLTTPIALTGTVVDATSGAPLQARIELFDGDGDRAARSFHSSAITGRYHRLLTGQLPPVMQVTVPGFTGIETLVSDDLTVALERDGLQGGGLWPFRARASQSVQLPASDVNGELVLVRVGVPDHRVSVADGAFIVSDSLMPGPWTVVAPDGRAWPNGLFVVDPDGAARATASEVDPSALTLSGSGFAEGSRAFVLREPVRALEPLNVLDESDTSLEIDVSSIGLDDTVDLIIITNGTWIGLGDVRHSMNLDTGLGQDTDPPDSGEPVVPDTGDERVRGTCSCTSSTGMPSGFSSWLIGLLWLKRRREES